MIDIIPAIDIIDGKCVRLTQGDFGQKTIYNENPLEMALRFENAGLKRLHLVDLDGARQGKIKNLKVLENIASNTNLVIDFGGGIKTDEDIHAVFDAGAAMANIGSVAVQQQDLFYAWLELYGSSKIILGADVMNEMVAVNGWQEQTALSVFDFIHDSFKQGIRSICCTDISKDGLLQGPSVELYKKLLNKNPELKLIASGGVSSIADIDDIQNIGCAGVIIGKAIYENRIKLSDLKAYTC